MDSITFAEGICYFYDHAEEAGIISPDNTNFSAIHTELNWKDCVEQILDKIRYRYIVGDFTLIKTTKMKNGKLNHVFKIELK